MVPKELYSLIFVPPTSKTNVENVQEGTSVAPEQQSQLDIFAHLNLMKDRGKETKDKLYKVILDEEKYESRLLSAVDYEQGIFNLAFL